MRECVSHDCDHCCIKGDHPSDDSCGSEDTCRDQINPVVFLIAIGVVLVFAVSISIPIVVWKISERMERSAKQS